MYGYSHFYSDCKWISKATITGYWNSCIPFVECQENRRSWPGTGQQFPWGIALKKHWIGAAWSDTEKKNGVILTWKVESLVELKFDPGFWVIGEYLSQIDSISSHIDSILRANLDWLSISKQFDSNIFQILGIPSRILLPPVTQLFM